MKRITNSFASGAASTTGFAASVTGATWPLTTTAATDGLYHVLTISGTTNHSGKSAAIVGIGPNGEAQSETIAALPNGVQTVSGSKYWKSVTSVTPSATIGADTMTIGWGAGSVSPWVPVANYNSPAYFNLGFVAQVTAGSPNYTVQGTYDDLLAVDHATVAAQTTTQEGTYTAPRSSIRVKFTVAGTVNLVVMAGHL